MGNSWAFGGCLVFCVLTFFAGGLTGLLALLPACPPAFQVDFNVLLLCTLIELVDGRITRMNE